MSDPLVSCIIPVYNGERYLGEAIDSVLTQTCGRVEIVVVDDGSTDGSAAVARSYGERVRYVSQPNAGEAAARNLGLREARGEYLAFLDADDLWHPEKLERQLGRFGTNPTLDYTVAHVQNFWVSELQEEAEQFRDHPRSRPMPGYVTGTLLATRRLVDAIGGFNEELRHSDDTEWFLRAEAAGARRELLPDVLLFRRMHPGNLSRTLAADSRHEYLRLVKAVLDRRRSGQGATEAQ